MNVVHNCAAHNCPVTRTRATRQERALISGKEDEITHAVDLNDLFLNLSQLRDGRILQRMQPEGRYPSLDHQNLLDKAVRIRRQRDAEEEEAEQGRKKRRRTRGPTQALTTHGSSSGTVGTDGEACHPQVMANATLPSPSVTPHLETPISSSPSPAMPLLNNTWTHLSDSSLNGPRPQASPAFPLWNPQQPYPYAYPPTTTRGISEQYSRHDSPYLYPPPEFTYPPL